MNACVSHLGRGDRSSSRSPKAPSHGYIHWYNLVLISTFLRISYPVFLRCFQELESGHLIFSLHWISEIGGCYVQVQTSGQLLVPASGHLNLALTGHLLVPTGRSF